MVVFNSFVFSRKVKLEPYYRLKIRIGKAPLTDLFRNGKRPPDQINGSIKDSFNNKRIGLPIDKLLQAHQALRPSCFHTLDHLGSLRRYAHNGGFHGQFSLIAMLFKHDLCQTFDKVIPLLVHSVVRKDPRGAVAGALSIKVAIVLFLLVL